MCIGPATYCFITFMLDSTCYAQHYAHHQELTTIVFVATQAVWFCKMYGVALVYVLGFVVCIRCENFGSFFVE